MSSDAACHDLLLRLAGRLPDAALWRARDWLAAGGHASIAAVLPRSLLRHRVGLTDVERELLEGSVGAWGASGRLVDAVLPLAAPDQVTAQFRTGAEADTALLSVLAVVRGHPGCAQLRQVWRRDPHGAQRVVLVVGADRPWALTGTLQRLLRAHGDRTPCAEVLPPHEDPPAYHQAAMIGAPLWQAPDRDTTAA